jgi:hypothetical protein
MGIRSRLRHDATPYLSVIMISIVVSRLLQACWPDAVVFKAQSPATMFQLAAVPVVVLLWLIFRAAKTPRKYLHLVLFALAGNFVFLFVLGAVRGESWSYVAALMPVTIALLWIKPPTYRAVIHSTNAFCISLIGAAVIYQAFVYLGVVESRNYLEHRFLGLAAVDFLRWRWEGPFGNVNFAGPAGAFLFVYGVTRFGWWRVTLMVVGGIFLVASECRGAMLGASVGLLTWLLSRDRLAGWKWNTRSKAVIASTGIVSLLSSFLIFDSTLNHRTEIWGDFLRLWVESPWFGFERLRLDTALQSGDVLLKDLAGQSLYFPGMEGHSLYVDTLTRFGAAGLLMGLFAIAVILVLCWKAYRKGMATGLIVALTFTVASLSDVLSSWLYLSFLILPLVIAALLSATWLQECESKGQSASSAPGKQETVAINA